MNFLGQLYFRRFSCILVRVNFSKACEKAINKQINMELQASHNYLAMAYYFNRCDVASPGAFNFFKDASHEEREHAEMLMRYMNKRGGTIKIEGLVEPKTSFESTKETMLEALNMEKEVNQSLLEVHAIATADQDPNLCDFIASNFLQEQVDAIKRLADLIRQTDRAECEVGNYHFDKYLLDTNRIMHKKK